MAPQRITIAPNEFRLNSIDIWANQWFLLTAGDLAAGKFNSMTVAWGSFGVMWAKPFAQVVVRPSRHTYGFMESSDTFTLCAFPAEYRDQLQYCGSHSGREVDKVAATGLTPIAAAVAAAPAFAEAELVVECRKMYWDDFKPPQFLDERIESCYNGADYHRVYFGEILAIQGTPAYRA
jgi:flavin reductase (DIM6/NTAB) family NADH-FMN oxidoreductase RutF